MKIKLKKKRLLILSFTIISLLITINLHQNLNYAKNFKSNKNYKDQKMFNYIKHYTKVKLAIVTLELKSDQKAPFWVRVYNGFLSTFGSSIFGSSVQTNYNSNKFTLPILHQSISKTIARYSNDNKRYYCKLHKCNYHLFYSKISKLYSKNLNKLLMVRNVMEYNSNFYDYVGLVGIDGVFMDLGVDIYEDFLGRNQINQNPEIFISCYDPEIIFLKNTQKNRDRIDEI